MRFRAAAPEFWRAVGATPPAQEIAGGEEGVGREGGIEGLQCYTVVKNISHLTA